MFFTFLTGVDEVDYDKYPEKSYQLKWIRIYLEEAAKIKGMGFLVNTRVKLSE